MTLDMFMVSSQVHYLIYNPLRLISESALHLREGIKDQRQELRVEVMSLVSG